MINVIKLFDIIYIMTLGGPNGKSQVIAYMMYDQTFQGGKGGYGSAIAVVMLLTDHPDHGLQHQTLPQRGDPGMTTQAAELVRPSSSTLAGRIVEFITAPRCTSLWSSSP